MPDIKQIYKHEGYLFSKRYGFVWLKKELHAVGGGGVENYQKVEKTLASRLLGMVQQ